MSKTYSILILFLGIFFIPTDSFACGSEKNSCTKEVATTHAKAMSCCGSNSDSSEESCQGKCGKSDCTSTSFISFTLLLANEIEFTLNNFDFSTKKSKFYDAKDFTLDGFVSVWLIPKIG